MTTQPHRRHRPKPARHQPTNLTNIAQCTAAVLSIAALITLFQTSPALGTLAMLAIGAVSLTYTHWPRHALPGHARTLNAFLQMTPAAFEHDIARLCRNSGAHKAVVVGGSNDRGADVLVTTRRYRYLVLKQDRRILIQCKRYTGAVGSEHVQIVNGTYRDIHRCDLALIVTTSDFTRDARATNALLRKPIRLINGTQLTAWANGGRPPWQ